VFESGPQIMVVVPLWYFSFYPIPLNNEVFIFDNARFQSNERVGNLKCGCRRESLFASSGVVADILAGFQIIYHKRAVDTKRVKVFLEFWLVFRQPFVTVKSCYSNEAE